jgi:hypothetical protein
MVKRKSMTAAFSLATLNPFGFLNIYRRGSAAMQKMVSIVAMQQFLEGKNISDFVEFWKRDHLKWTVEDSRNFLMGYGTLCIIAGLKITPIFLQKLSARGFTSTTNLTNLIGFAMRGFKESTWLFLLAMPILLPGVNGASSTALKGIVTDLASKEGFGKGEFSAWTNNLRALAGSVATVIYGHYYAWAKNAGVPAGTTFMIAALFGTVVPEIILRCTSDKEIEQAKRRIPSK